MINKSHLCFILTTLVSINHGTPIHLTLNDPCGGARVARASWWTGIPNTSRNTTLEDVSNSAFDSAVEAKNLRLKYNNNEPYARIANSLVTFLASIHLPNLPHTRSTTGNISQVLQEDYNGVARIAVYMENVLKQENSSSVNTYSREMSSFISTLGNTLCKIKLAADDHLLRVFVDNTTIPENRLQTSSIAERYCRDYIVFRDSQIYLTDMASDYSSYI